MPKKHHGQQLKILFAFALICASFAVFSINRIEEKVPQLMANPKVFSGLSERFKDVKRIKITIPEGAFQLVRSENGWLMPERSNFKVDSAFINNFAFQISNLERGDLITSDAAQIDSLGVGEPMEFGQGSIVETFDAQDQIIAASHIGLKGNQVFVRAMGDPRVYNGIGNITDFSHLTAWLDLNWLNINPEEIAQIELLRSDESIRTIKRDDNGAFSLNGKTSLSISNLAMFVTKVRFVDVAPKTRINSSKTAGLIITKTDGTKLEFSFYKQYKVNWLKLNTIGDEALNQKSQDWAFAFDEASAAELYSAIDAL